MQYLAVNTFRIQPTLRGHNTPQTATRVLELNPEGDEAVNTGETDPGQLGGQPGPLAPPHGVTVHKLVEAAAAPAQRQHVQGLEVGDDLDPDLVRDGEDPLLGGGGRHVQLHHVVTKPLNVTTVNFTSSLLVYMSCLQIVCCVSVKNSSVFLCFCLALCYSLAQLGGLVWVSTEYCSLLRKLREEFKYFPFKAVNLGGVRNIQAR